MFGAGLGEGVLANIASSLIVQLYKNRSRLSLLHAGLFGGSREMRVAFSALLRIQDNGRYVLIRNLHRRETFGPMGGVIKYYPEAKRSLDSLEFVPREVDPDMRHDLRGFLPARHAGKLHSWYTKNVNRELAVDCIRRELAEEMGEIALSPKLKVPGNLRLDRIRTVIEGPEHVAGQEYKQYRIFEIYDPVLDTKAAKTLFQGLVKSAHSHKDLLMASPQEIKVGRCQSGELLGNHCCYLLGERRTRPDIPAFVEAGPARQQMRD